MTPAQERLAFPLDVRSLSAAERWLDLLAGELGVFKVGLQLFTAAGPDAVRVVQSRGRRCFLDLKLHDIPATMRRAVEASVALDVAYLTLHASAGSTALREATAAANGTGLHLLAVTVLTSLGDADVEALGISGGAADATARLADLAHEAGIRGFVCSPLECAALRARLPGAPVLVTPGVRPSFAAADDQQRTATPAQAIAAGADLLVVGRPIRDASDPVAAARAVVGEIAAALE